MLVVSACGGPATPALSEPTPVPAVDPNPNPVLPHSDKGLRFERISIEQGLSHSTVNCSLQDSKGFIRFGTEDGLNVYDGSSFTVYNHDPNEPHSLSHNQNTSLH